MSFRTVLIVTLTLLPAGFASAQPASGFSVTDVELIEQLRRREAILRKELVVDFTVTRSRLPGHEEQEALKEQALEVLYQRGAFREKPEYTRTVFYSSYGLEPMAYTVGVRGRKLRLEYDDRGFDLLTAEEPGHNTVYYDGKVCLSYRDPPYRGVEAGYIDAGQAWETSWVLALQAAGLCIHNPIDGRLDTSACLSEFFKQARAQGNLEAVKADQSSEGAGCYVLTGYVATEDRPGCFTAARAFLDPERGCTPVRIEWGTREKAQDGQMEERWSARVVDVEFSDVGDGIWFPMKADFVLSEAELVPDPNKPQKDWQSKMLDMWNLALVVSKVHVGESPAGYRFGFRFPWGTKVRDGRTGKPYTVGTVSLLKSPLALSVGGVAVIVLVTLGVLRARKRSTR